MLDLWTFRFVIREVHRNVDQTRKRSRCDVEWTSDNQNQLIANHFFGCMVNVWLVLNNAWFHFCFAAYVPHCAFTLLDIVSYLRFWIFQTKRKEGPVQTFLAVASAYVEDDPIAFFPWVGPTCLSLCSTLTGLSRLLPVAGPRVADDEGQVRFADQ